jgi:hypothetical protein
MKTSGAGLLCSFAWMLSACGSAASYDYPLPEPAGKEPPLLGRIHGQTVGQTTARRDLLQIALVWFPVSPRPGDFQVSQSVAWRSTTPLGDVDIDVLQQPPPHAIKTADMMRYGQAELVLYEDNNRNGELDVVFAAGAQQSHDRVVGRANGFRAWWLADGSPAPPEERGYKPITQGLSFTYGPIKAEPDPYLCSPDAELGGKLSCPRTILREPAYDVSAQDIFTITVSDDVKLQSYACRGFWGTNSEKVNEWPDTTPGWNAPAIRDKICNRETCDNNGQGDKLDLPVVGRPVEVTCDAHKTVYGWKDCEPDPNLCGTVFCHIGYGKRDPSQPIPKDWPCKMTTLARPAGQTVRSD